MSECWHWHYNRYALHFQPPDPDSVASQRNTLEQSTFHKGEIAAAEEQREEEENKEKVRHPFSG